jgi:soluble lytic murein transglycosylase-like protein
LNYQQFISKSFDTIVATINSIVFIRSVAPVLLLVAGFEFALIPRVLDANDPELASVQYRSIGWANASAATSEQLETIDLKPAQRASLTKAQHNIASYVSKAYRVGFDEAARYVATAFQVAKEHKVDPMLVVAIMSIESSFNPVAQSHAGAQGLMQVLTRVHPEKFRPFGGVGSAFDVYANIYVGTRIIGEYLAREGSTEGALKSYVGAALMSDDAGYGWKVMSQMERFRAVAQGKPMPPMPIRPVATKAGDSDRSLPELLKEQMPEQGGSDSIRTLLPAADTEAAEAKPQAE